MAVFLIVLMFFLLPAIAKDMKGSGLEFIIAIFIPFLILASFFVN